MITNKKYIVLILYIVCIYCIKIVYQHIINIFLLIYSWYLCQYLNQYFIILNNILSSYVRKREKDVSQNVAIII